MAILGWIALGLLTAALASGLRRGERGHGVLAGRFAIGTVGAVLAGLVATAAGVGSIGDLFHIGAWLIAIGGALLALVTYELASRDRPGAPGSQKRSWAVRRAGGESERLDRNW